MTGHIPQSKASSDRTESFYSPEKHTTIGRNSPGEETRVEWSHASLHPRIHAIIRRTSEQITMDIASISTNIATPSARHT
eukprot:4980877-Pyramimonas_sp.AAC.1